MKINYVKSECKLEKRIKHVQKDNYPKAQRVFGSVKPLTTTCDDTPRV